MMGIEMVSVERKLQMTSAPDIGADDLRYRRMANEVIKAHSKAHPGIRNQWTPILYAYELYRPEVKEMSRMGHMVWTDPTLTRFLLVFCWPNPSCGHMSADFAKALTSHGQRFLNLVTYLRESETELNPEWVRVTYITASQPKWDPRFLSDQTRSFATATAPIVHLTRADLKPTLNANDLDCIDAVIAKDPSMRRKLPQPGVRELVFTERDLRPSIDFFHSHERTIECGGCRVVKPVSQMQKRKAWTTHKHSCIPTK